MELDEWVDEKKTSEEMRERKHDQNILYGKIFSIEIIIIYSIPTTFRSINLMLIILNKVKILKTNFKYFYVLLTIKIIGYLTKCRF